MSTPGTPRPERTPPPDQDLSPVPQTPGGLTASPAAYASPASPLSPARVGILNRLPPSVRKRKPQRSLSDSPVRQAASAFAQRCQLATDSLHREAGGRVLRRRLPDGNHLWTHSDSLAPPESAALVSVGYLQGAGRVVVKQQDIKEHHPAAQARQAARHQREGDLAQRSASAADRARHGLVAAGSSSYLIQPYGSVDLSALCQMGLSAQQRLDFLLQVAPGLLEHLQRCADAGIVHADVKPANVVLLAEVPSRGMLIDFGEAFVPSEGGRASEFSENYAAPEVVLGRQQPSFANDVFCAGATLLQLALGMAHSPFSSEGLANPKDADAVQRPAYLAWHAGRGQGQPAPGASLWDKRVALLPPKLALLIVDGLMHPDPQKRPTDLLACAQEFAALQRPAGPGQVQTALKAIDQRKDASTEFSRLQQFAELEGFADALNRST
jgi:serine/threonine protein kinase